MALPNPLKHLNKYGEANLDATTLRHLIRAASTWWREQWREYVEILADMPNQESADEYQAIFAQEEADNIEAIERIKAELKKRGLEL